MKTSHFLFVLAVALLATVSSAPAQTVSPVPTPTIITKAPFTINTPGYYQLGANLFYAGNSNVNNDAIITIDASNVTLDFAGHYISGPSSNAAGSTLYGVYANERGNLVIENGTVAFCRYGIFLDGNGNAGSLNINQTVRNMLVSYCYASAIAFNIASNSAVLNSRISFIGGDTNGSNAAGIYLVAGSGNKAVGNTIVNVNGIPGQGGAVGISGAGGTSFTAANNTVNNVTASGSGGAFGVGNATFTVNNTILNCQYGVYNGGKYMGNLTSGCTTPFSGGTAVGVNH